VVCFCFFYALAVCYSLAVVIIKLHFVIILLTSLTFILAMVLAECRVKLRFLSSYECIDDAGWISGPRVFDSAKNSSARSSDGSTSGAVLSVRVRFHTSSASCYLTYYDCQEKDSLLNSLVRSVGLNRVKLQLSIFINECTVPCGPCYTEQQKNCRVFISYGRILYFLNLYFAISSCEDEVISSLSCFRAFRTVFK
jgi:hypothetical protein